MRIAIASLLAAVVLFFFGFLWWGILMPIVKPANAITDATVVEKLASSLNESNIYFYPDYAGEYSEDQTGPTAMLYFHKEMPSMGKMMGLGFAHMVLSALLVSVSLSFSGRRTFAERFAFVFFLGLFVAVWADLGNMVWWRYPLAWTGYHFAYDVLSWLLAGLVIALIVKPKLVEEV